MRSRNFVDEQVLEELKKLPNTGSGDNPFPEHSFIASSLKVGLTINDLKMLSYVDVMKILISYIDKPEKENKPTQAQISMLTG